MSIRVMTAVWNGTVKDQGDLLVLLALADFADDSGACFPSMRTIAEKARMTERGARKAVRRLEERGYLKCEIGGGRGGSNVYIINANAEHGSDFIGGKPGTEFPPERGSPRNLNAQNPELECTKPGTPVPPNRKEPSKNRQNVKDKAVKDVLLECISEEMAEDFIAHRREMKSPMTERGARLLVNRISQHPNPNAVVALSIENGWKGVFPEKVTSVSPSQQKGRWAKL